MQKTLIALAVLAASGAAMAQSSVTLYGRVDTGIGSEKTLAGGSQTKMVDGGLTTSRLGFRGTEDLGGGLSALFQLEQRLDLSSGALQAPSFKAASLVGLSGGFGTVKLGRMTTVFDDARAVSYSSNVFDSAFTPASNGVYKDAGGDYASRFNNQIRYDSPSFGGFYGGASYAFEQTAGVGDKLTAVQVGYKAGPMHVVLGHQNEKTKSKFTALSGSYDFGMASLSAGYNLRNGTASDDKEYTFGVNVPMGAVNLSAGYAASETESSAGVTTAKASGFGFGATYSLSKRTRLYAGYRSHDVKDAAGVKTTDTTLYAVGIRHDF
jgi:predicted porin